jgi:hypothetical protein
MASMTYGVGGQTSARAARANCAHLHSAFGPGCPYCEQADGDTAHLLGDHLGPEETGRPDHHLDLGIVA